MQGRTEQLRNFVSNNKSNPGTPESNEKTIKPTTQRSASRQGKKMASVFFDKAVHKQLQMLRIETDMSIQDLLIKAINLLFSSYNKPPIAK